MQIFRTRIAWAAYIIGTALFFLYILFPSDAVKEYLADLIRQMQPQLTLEIGRLKPGFPPDLKLYDVSVYHSGRAIAELGKLKISPNILSLFLTTTQLSFTGRGYGGVLKGGVDITQTSEDREVVIDADLDGIQVNQLEALSALTPHEISGNLDGTLTFSAKVPRGALMGNLSLTDAKIELSPPIFSQKELTFNSIDAELVLSGGFLRIKRCQIQGNQLDGEVAGSIEFSGHSSAKILDLSGTVRPHETLLAQMGQHVPKLLANSNLRVQGFPFKIKGPLDSPTYSFY